MKNLNLKAKLLILFLACGLIPLFVVGIFAYSVSQDSLEYASFNQLKGVQAIKKAQIEQFFNERKGLR